MQKSSFFNSINGDRKYNASDYAAYFGSFIGNGVYPNPGNNLAVTASGGMNISVAAGKAWINGYYYENTGTFNMSIDPADGVLKRIDRIVLRLDHLNRQIVLAVLKGTPASTPTASLLTRTSDIYELGIADILINNGDTAILQENITDQRLNSDLCGIVHGTVEQVNTSEIFNQYQAALDSFKKEKYEDFTTWVDNLKDILDESTAGNLLNLINENTSYLDTHLSDYTNHVTPLGITSNVDNTYSITSSKIITDGSKFSLKFNVAATGAATLNISSEGTPRRLIKPGGADFKPKAGTYLFIRDGENFQCLGEGGEYGTATANSVLQGYTVGTENGIEEGTAKEVIIRPTESQTDVGLANNIFFNTSIYDGVTQFMPSWTFSISPTNRVWTSPTFKCRATVFFSSLSFRATRTGTQIYQASFKAELLDPITENVLILWSSITFAYGETNKLINGGGYSSDVLLQKRDYKLRITHSGSSTLGTITSFGIGSSDNTRFMIVADTPLFVNV